MKASRKRAEKLLPAKEIPCFEDDEKAMEWFDSHDTSQLLLEEVTSDSEKKAANVVRKTLPSIEGPESVNRSAFRLQTIAVRLSNREIGELRKRAARLGIGYTTYVRILINRHVLDEPPLIATQMRGRADVIDDVLPIAIKDKMRRDIADLLAEGATVSQIAKMLELSRETVERRIAELNKSN